MAAWTSNCWGYVVEWFQTGNTTNICYPEIGVSAAVNPQERIKLMQVTPHPPPPSPPNNHSHHNNNQYRGYTKNYSISLEMR